MAEKADLQVVLKDIDLVLNSTRCEEITTGTVSKLIPQIQTWNLLHGAYILKKIMSIHNLEIPHNFAIAVFLHDMAKYKNQPEIIQGIFDHLLTSGTYVPDVFTDHGSMAAYLLLRVLQPTDPADISFLYFHTKTYPWKLDPSKIPKRDLAFYLLDDIVKGVKRYGFPMNRSDYLCLTKFLNRPMLSDMDHVFQILKQYKLGSK